MAKNLVYRPGTALSLPVPVGTLSGEPVKVGGFCGVAVAARGKGVGSLPTHSPVDLSGCVWEIPVDGAITGAGQPIYIVTATRALTVTSAGNELWGHSAPAADGTFTTKAAGVAPAYVKPLTV